MMRLLVLASLFAVSACGSLNKNNNSDTPAVSSDAAKAKSAELPTVAIVRVPVGADGKEINEKAEMRTTNAASLSQANVESTFGAAQVPTQTVDELDKSTSTESFCGWRRWNVGYGRGYVNGYNNGYNNGYYNGAYNWNYYRPTYYNRGYYYNYNYNQSYSYNSYNYYQYNSSFSNSYSGYGVAPGYYGY